MERDTAFRPPPQPSRLRVVGWSHLSELTERSLMTGERIHRRTRSAPLDPGVLQASPSSASHGPLSSPSRLIGTRRRSSTSGIGACIGASGLSPPQHRTLRMQSSRHRRAISLTSETASLIARKDACAAHGGSIGGSRRGSGGSAACTAQMLELVSAPASLRLRRTEAQSFRALASSSVPRKTGSPNVNACRAGSGRSGGSNSNSSSSSSSASARHLAGSCGSPERDVAGIGATGGVGSTTTGSVSGSSPRREALAGTDGDEVVSPGREQESPPPSHIRVDRDEAGGGGSSSSPDYRRKEDPPTLGLSKRRSSDSTLAVWDSPQYLPEELKTDEEDFLGRAKCYDVSAYPFVLPPKISLGDDGGLRFCKGGASATEQFEDVNIANRESRIALLVDTRVRPSSAPCASNSTFSQEEIPPSGYAASAINVADAEAFVRDACEARLETHHEKGALTEREEVRYGLLYRGCNGTDEEETVRANSFRVSMPPAVDEGVVEWENSGAEAAEASIRSSASLTAKEQNHLDARDNNGAASLEVCTIMGTDCAEQAAGASAVLDSPTAIAGDSADGTGALSLDGHDDVGLTSDSNRCGSGSVALADDSGEDIERSSERSDIGRSACVWRDGREMELERRRSLLDVYRERDSWAMENDWGELDDVRGLPGLGVGSAHVGSEVDSKLQAPPLIFRPGAVDEGDVLSLMGEPRMGRQGTTTITAETASATEQEYMPSSGADICTSGPNASLTRKGAEESCTELVVTATDGPREGVYGVNGDRGNVDPRGKIGPRVISPSRLMRRGGGWPRGGSRSRGIGAGNEGRSSRVRQPLLLSLADLTEAGLETLLQAKEGDSKMYFDPDAQRWIGEEVDLSGFEDAIPSPADAAVNGVVFEGDATDATDVTDTEAGATYGLCAQSGAGADSDATDGGVAPAQQSLSQSSADGLCIEPTGLPPSAGRYAGHGRASPPLAPTSSAHRRWSSGGEAQGPRARWCISHGSHGCPSSETRRGTVTGCPVQQSSESKLFHRRTRSADRRLDTSVSSGKCRTGGGSAGGGGGNRNGGATGYSRSARIAGMGRHSRHGGGGSGTSRLSSAASSNSLQSESDTGSVVRLIDENYSSVWDEGDSRRERESLGTEGRGRMDGGGAGIAGVAVETRRRRASAGNMPKSNSRTHHRRASAPADGAGQNEGRRDRGARGRDRSTGPSGNSTYCGDGKDNGEREGGGIAAPARTSPRVERKRTNPGVVEGLLNGPRDPRLRSNRREESCQGVRTISASAKSPPPGSMTNSGLPPRASSPATLPSGSPPTGRELTSLHRSTDSPPEIGWPWVSMSAGSSPLLGLEGGLASGSEMGASETSDWDQDGDFDLPENPEFKLTLEKPTKFGYSPSYFAAISGGEGCSSGAPSLAEEPPPFAPGLLRISTAPPAASSFVEYPHKGSGGPGGDVDGRIGGVGVAEDRGGAGRSQRRSAIMDHRFDSLGSAAEWDQTFTGELDISLAQATRSPAVAAPSPGTQAAENPDFPPSASPESDPTPGSQAEGGGVSTTEGESTGAAPLERSAVSIAWEAFKAHSSGARGGNMGDSLKATVQDRGPFPHLPKEQLLTPRTNHGSGLVQAAATATSIAMEHLRKRNRSRLLMEKGGGQGRRLSGPLQITLEDFKAPPSACGVSMGECVDAAGTEKPSSSGSAEVTDGAHFNRERMRWEGFEEPDLTGFDTSDSETECSPFSPKSPRLPHKGGGVDSVGSAVHSSEATGLVKAHPDVAAQMGAASSSEVCEQYPRVLHDTGGGSSGCINDGGVLDSVVCEETLDITIQSSSGDARSGGDSADGSVVGAAADAGRTSGDVSHASDSSGPSSTTKREPFAVARSTLGILGDRISDACRGLIDPRPEQSRSRFPSVQGDNASASELDEELGVLGAAKDGLGDMGDASSRPEPAAISPSNDPALDVARKSLAGELPSFDCSESSTSDMSDQDRKIGSATVGLEVAVPACTPLVIMPTGSSFSRIGSFGSVDRMMVVGDASGISPPFAAPVTQHPAPGVSSTVATPRSTAGKSPVALTSLGDTLGVQGEDSTGARATVPVSPPIASSPCSDRSAQRDVAIAKLSSGGLGSVVVDGSGPTGAWSAGGCGSSTAMVEERVAAVVGRGRMHLMVPRSIYSGPMREASALESGDGDIRASASHMTKSTEDDTVDDWGADFVGQIILTPKKGSVWDGKSEDGDDEDDEGDDTEGLASPSPPGSPHRGMIARRSVRMSMAKNRASLIAEAPTADGPEKKSVSPSVSPRRRRHRNQASQDRDDNVPSPRNKTSGWGPSFLLPFLGGRLRGGRRRADNSSKKHSQRRHPLHNHSPPAVRSSLYGPSVKRITVDMKSGSVFGGGGGVGSGFGFGSSAGAAGGMNDGWRKASSRHLDGAVSAGGAGDDGDDEGEEEERAPHGRVDKGDGDKGTSGVDEAQCKAKKEHRRKRRSRGYQTITKQEYTPMHVPTACLNPKTGRWEPIDGYAVDMSGFRNEGGDSNSDPGSSRRTSVSSGCGGISGDGNGSRGSASGGGTNSMASPCVPKGQTASSGTGSSPGPKAQTRRSSSISASNGNGGVSRADAFYLSPATLRHLARSEQAHDLAMTYFLGDQNYSRAKQRGATRLLGSPGIAAAAKTRLPPTGTLSRTRRRVAETSSDRSGRMASGAEDSVNPGRDEGAHESARVEGPATPSGYRYSIGASPKRLIASSSPPGCGSTTIIASGRSPSPAPLNTNMVTPPQRRGSYRGRSPGCAENSPRSGTRSGRREGVNASASASGGSSTTAAGATTTTRGRAGPDSARSGIRRKRSSSSTGVLPRRADGDSGRGINLPPWGWGGGVLGTGVVGDIRVGRRLSADQPTRTRSASHAPASSRSRSVHAESNKSSGQSPFSWRRRDSCTKGSAGGDRAVDCTPPPRRDPSIGRFGRPWAARNSNSPDGAVAILDSRGTLNVPRSRSRSCSTTMGSGGATRGRNLSVPRSARSSSRLSREAARKSSMSPPRQSPPRVIRTPPLNTSAATSSAGGGGGGSGGSRANVFDISRYGRLDEAVMRRAATSPPPAPFSPRTYRFNRTSSTGRLGPSAPRSRAGSSLGVALNASTPGDYCGGCRDGGRTIAGRGSVSGTAAAAMVAAAAAAAAGGHESAAEERARVEHRLARFRDTAEFAASTVRDRIGTLGRVSPDELSRKSDPSSSRRGHRRRGSAGASSEGSAVTGAFVGPTVRR